MGGSDADAATVGKPLHELSVREATQAMAASAFTAESYVEALLDWQRHWQMLNAYTQQQEDAVRTAARAAAAIRSPIAGLPIAVKDNIDVAGYATTAGTPALRRHIARSSAPVVRSLIDQGVVVMGKTGLHEMAAGGTCGNITFGQVRNPYDPAMVPGGSSGGSAAAVGGQDGPCGARDRHPPARSARRRPTAAASVSSRPRGATVASALSLATSGATTLGWCWFARSCDDVALLDACCAPAALTAPISLAGLRLGVPRAYFYETLEPAVAPVIEAMLARLSDAGVDLIEVDLPGVGDLLAQLGPMGRDLAAGLNVYIAESGAQVTAEDIVHGIADPQLRRGMEAALAAQAGVPPSTSAPAAVEALKAAYAGYFAAHRVAAMIFPTSPEVAYPAPADLAAGGTGPVAMIRNTLPGAHAGLPGLSIPAGLTAAGLPVGIELDGPLGSDRALLGIGAAIEAITPPLPPPPLPT
ncbi:MAG: amidase family protein [Caulobacteraceae bacterium]